MNWPKVTVQTPAGPQAAIAPLVISASRATDVPAFHASWFAARLVAGYCRWINPFNGRPQYVSFEKCRAVVFWSKNPAPIFPVLDVLEERGIGCYFQYTLNDYDADGLEPNVPLVAERVETFRRLSQRLGKARVIWRFDPLLLTDRIDENALVDKVQRLGERLSGLTEKLIISFADIGSYTKVRRNLQRHGVNYREFDGQAMQMVAAGVARAARSWGVRVAACCESVDLASLGIERSRCIDGELLLRISGNDPELARYCSPDAATDPGQRDTCGCARSKDIGQYSTCPHLCRYCYANTSEAAVARNLWNASATGESICQPEGATGPRQG